MQRSGNSGGFEAGGRALWLLSAPSMNDNAVRQLSETMFTNSKRHCRDSSHPMHFQNTENAVWMTAEMCALPLPDAARRCKMLWGEALRVSVSYEIWRNCLSDLNWAEYMYVLCCLGLHKLMVGVEEEKKITACVIKHICLDENTSVRASVRDS